VAHEMGSRAEQRDDVLGVDRVVAAKGAVGQVRAGRVA
jgi:hypothetical protein